MNVLRSLARELFSLYGTDASKRSGEAGLRTALDKKVVPPVVNLSRYHDSFDRLPTPANAKSAKGTQGAKPAWSPLATAALDSSFEPAAVTSSLPLRFSDGFDAGRRARVDLTGGVKPPVLLPEERPAAKPAGSNGFTASLDDLL